MNGVLECETFRGCGEFAFCGTGCRNCLDGWEWWSDMVR